MNWGCVPSKALLRNAELINLFKRGKEFGFSFDNFQYDIAKAVERSRTVSKTHVSGVQFLMKKNKIESINGEAVIAGANKIEIKPTGETLNAKSIIIATGARSRSLPGLTIDKKSIITSREALDMRKLPSAIVIVGGGAIGVEFAYYLKAYGSDVTIIEMMPHLVPNEDEDISIEVERSFKKQGIKVLTGAKVDSADRKGDGILVKYSQGAEKGEVACENVLVGIGVQPNSDNLGLEKLGIEMDRGYIKINGNMQTNVPNIYAIGDVTGKLLLAHVASTQGVAAAERIAGRETPAINYSDMPRATYCQPQVASIGLTESQAKAKGLNIKVGKFHFRNNGKASGIAETEGLVKLIVDAKYGDLIGAHMVGPDVTELLAEVGVLKMLEGTASDLGWMTHAHPTLSEAVKQAALAATGEAIDA